MPVRDQGVAGSNPVSPTNSNPPHASGFAIEPQRLFSQLSRFGTQVALNPSRTAAVMLTVFLWSVRVSTVGPLAGNQVVAG